MNNAGCHYCGGEYYHLQVKCPKVIEDLRSFRRTQKSWRVLLLQQMLLVMNYDDDIFSFMGMKWITKRRDVIFWMKGEYIVSKWVLFQEASHRVAGKK
jgi:hypothetical protein